MSNPMTEFKLVKVSDVDLAMAIQNETGCADSDSLSAAWAVQELYANQAHDGEVVYQWAIKNGTNTWHDMSKEDYEKHCGTRPDDHSYRILHTAPPRVVDEAMVERGLQAAASASDARLARYSVVIEILKAALEEK